MKNKRYKFRKGQQVVVMNSFYCWGEHRLPVIGTVIKVGYWPRDNKSEPAEPVVQVLVSDGLGTANCAPFDHPSANERNAQIVYPMAFSPVNDHGPNKIDYAESH